MKSIITRLTESVGDYIAHNTPTDNLLIESSENFTKQDLIDAFIEKWGATYKSFDNSSHMIPFIKKNHSANAYKNKLAEILKKIKELKVEYESTIDDAINDMVEKQPNLVKREVESTLRMKNIHKSSYEYHGCGYSEPRSHC